MQPDQMRPAPPTTVPPRQPAATPVASASSAEAAANVVRNQLDRIYASDPNQVQTAPQPTQSAQTNVQADNQQTFAPNPYMRTHSNAHHVQANSWQKYHTAWQSYYQQYYERYYVSQVHEAKKSLESEAGVKEAPVDTTMSTEEAVYDLRSKLREQINERAKKVRKSRHFVPIVSALGVMLIFAFLQYNRVIFANVEAYVSPGNLESSALIVDPNSSQSVGPDPKLIIPKIAVDVPIIWDANAANQDSLNAAMDRGVVWFNIRGANAKPGEIGNFVVSGHSSNDWLDSGDYKFIFARLEQMREGDTVYVNYEGLRYTYEITGSKVVKPNDVDSLRFPTSEPMITLITCTPLGTALNRLLVFAKQISPDPSAATAPVESSDDSGEADKMPSNSPTFFERIFGIRN